MATSKAGTKKPITKAASKAVETAPAAASVTAEAAPKKTVAKKAAAKKETTEAVIPAATVVFEYADKKVAANDLAAKALETFQANHTDIQIQDMQIYVKADDNCAYIVVNGTEYPDDKILL